MKRPFNFRVTPLILCGMILAICAITFCETSVILALVAFAFIALLSAIFIKQIKKARTKLIVCILAFFFTLGLSSLSYTRIANTEIYASDAIVEASVDMLTQSNGDGVIEISEDFDKRTEIYLDNIVVDGKEIKGKARTVFYSSELLEGLKIGDRIKFKGNIAPLNFVVTDSYSMKNYRNGIFHYVYCDTHLDEDVLFLKVSSGVNLADRIKLKIKSSLYKNTRSDTAGFLYAMTFGDKSGLDNSISNAFSYTGTAHVFAVSGLHVGILASALIWIFKKVKLRNHVARLAIMSAVLFIFCALCDFSPSTLRATLMTLTMMFARALGRRNDGLSSMSLAAIVILTIRPLYLFDIGFLMSFLAVVGIFTLYKPIKEKVFKKLPKKLSSLLATSISVNLTLLPIMMCYFSGGTLLFIVANLILLPVMGLFFPIYLVACCISAILPFMGWSITAVAAPFTLIMMLIGKLAQLPTLVVKFDFQALFVVIAIICAVTLSQYVFANKTFKKIMGAVLCFTLIFTLSTSLRLWGSDDLYVACFTDKYQCQYLLIDNAFGGQYLVINDKTSSDSADAVKNAMKENKFGKIDGIIIVGEVDKTQLEKLMMHTGCSYIYSFSQDYMSIGIFSGDSVLQDGLTVGFINRGVLDIVADRVTVRVVADGYNVVNDDYDVLVTYSPIDSVPDGKYAVCEQGFQNSMKNYVSGTFTFELNNDRIKVERFWRY